MSDELRFNKMGRSALDIPEVSATIITVDEFMHVKLFKKSTPIPLSEWFRKGQCVLKRNSMLENFPPYIRSFVDVGNNLTDVDKIPSSLLDEK